MIYMEEWNYTINHTILISFTLELIKCPNQGYLHHILPSSFSLCFVSNWWHWILISWARKIPILLDCNDLAKLVIILQHCFLKVFLAQFVFLDLLNFSLHLKLLWFFPFSNWSRRWILIVLQAKTKNPHLMVLWDSNNLVVAHQPRLVCISSGLQAWWSCRWTTTNLLCHLVAIISSIHFCRPWNTWWEANWVPECLFAGPWQSGCKTEKTEIGNC